MFFSLLDMFLKNWKSPSLFPIGSISWTTPSVIFLPDALDCRSVGVGVGVAWGLILVSLFLLLVLRLLFFYFFLFFFFFLCSCLLSLVD